MLAILICITTSSYAQNMFIGTWHPNKADPGYDYVLGDLKVSEKETIFDVIYNQLGLDCKNVFRNDTLYLYVVGSDQGRGFTGPKYYPPKPKSLFAKCYIEKNILKLIYTQKLFYNNIKDLGLNTSFTKHD